MPSSKDEDDDYYVSSFRYFPVALGDTEDLEKYTSGGFHPVHLGDLYDGRFRVVHKLGAGGFSTVWLARDDAAERWVALKIVVAEHSAFVEAKTSKLRGVMLLAGQQKFWIDGPNGRHICFVLPVLGPSASQLSQNFSCRTRPWLCRKAGYQAAEQLANLHEQGFCHGDTTTANIVFTLSSVDHYSETDLKRIFGSPETAPVETETGEIPGPEAPTYIVRTLDFLAASENLIRADVHLIDFDQSFPISSPPQESPGTPSEFLAPELAVGLPASPASDVWALGCSIFRLRSGETPFAGYENNCPANAMGFIMKTLGDQPVAWQFVLFDDDGQITKDPSKGLPIERWEEEDRPLRALVDQIYDEPAGRLVMTGKVRAEHKARKADENEPFPSCFSELLWKPTAVKIDNTYLYGFNDETDKLLEAMPKILTEEANLLYDLLSKIFVYEPEERITAREMMDHPWFHMDD